jgi:hypothetical protein
MASEDTPVLTSVDDGLAFDSRLLLGYLFAICPMASTPAQAARSGRKLGEHQ